MAGRALRGHRRHVGRLEGGREGARDARRVLAGAGRHRHGTVTEVRMRPQRDRPSLRAPRIRPEADPHVPDLVGRRRAEVSDLEADAVRLPGSRVERADELRPGEAGGREPQRAGLVVRILGFDQDRGSEDGADAGRLTGRARVDRVAGVLKDDGVGVARGERHVHVAQRSRRPVTGLQRRNEVDRASRQEGLDRGAGAGADGRVRRGPRVRAVTGTVHLRRELDPGQGRPGARRVDEARAAVDLIDGHLVAAGDRHGGDPIGGQVAGAEACAADALA